MFFIPYIQLNIHREFTKARDRSSRLQLSLKNPNYFRHPHRKTLAMNGDCHLDSQLIIYYNMTYKYYMISSVIWIPNWLLCCSTSYMAKLIAVHWNLHKKLQGQIDRYTLPRCSRYFLHDNLQVFKYIDSSYVGHLRNDSPQPSFVKIHDSDQKILVFPALSGEVVVGLLKYLKIILLVVSTHLKNMKSVGMIIPNIWKVIKTMFQSPPTSHGVSKAQLGKSGPPWSPAGPIHIHKLGAYPHWLYD